MRTKTLSEFRQSARTALSGKWGLAIITGIIASFLGGASSGGGGINFNLPSDADFSESLEGSLDMSSAFEAVLSELSSFWLVFGTAIIISLVIAFIVGVAYFALGSIVSVGYAKFNLTLVDGENAALEDLFAYFKHWKNVILANLLRSLYVFLWSLLCFIPGIIASYSYAMVPYIMADNPELSASEALERSRKMMDGNKVRFFCLSLSFIGWAILCSFTCGIGNLALTPYVQATTADFYREISDTRPVHETFEEIPTV